MRTIKDVFKKVDEMKKEERNTLGPKPFGEVARKRRLKKRDYNQALEDVKPIIKKEIKMILEGLKDDISSKEPENGGRYHREMELREDIEEIVG